MAIDTALGVRYGDSTTGSYYSNILQDLFLPAMADAVIYPNTLLKRLPRDGRRVEGKLVKFPVHYDDANGVSAIGAGGLLPDPDTEKFAQYAFGIRHLYVRLKFDGITKDATATQKASWLDVLMYESEAKSKILARARQRIFHNDGSGRLAEAVSHSGGAVDYTVAGTITARINQGIESPATCSTAPTKFLKPGMIVAFVSVVAHVGTLKAVGTIASVTGNTTFTLSGVVNVGAGGNVAAGDWIVTASQVLSTLTLASTGFHNEPMGISGIVSDADPDSEATDTFQGLATASNAWMRATILANAGLLRPLTLALMDQAWTTCVKVGDNVPTVGLCSFELVQQYAQLLIADRRFVGQTTYDGGYKALDYNGVPLVADRDCFDNRLTFLDETDLTINVMADPQWMNMDGSIYSRMQERDEYQATLYMREQLSSDMRRKHVCITDLVQ